MNSLEVKEDGGDQMSNKSSARKCPTVFIWQVKSLSYKQQLIFIMAKLLFRQFDSLYCVYFKMWICFFFPPNLPLATINRYGIPHGSLSTHRLGDCIYFYTESRASNSVISERLRDLNMNVMRKKKRNGWLRDGFLATAKNTTFITAFASFCFKSNIFLSYKGFLKDSTHLRHNKNIVKWYRPSVWFLP